MNDGIVFIVRTCTRTTWTTGKNTKNKGGKHNGAAQTDNNPNSQVSPFQFGHAFIHNACVAHENGILNGNGNWGHANGNENGLVFLRAPPPP